jgi:hypothetical protein
MDPVTAALNFATQLMQLIETAQKRDIAMLDGMTPEQRAKYIDRVEARETRIEAFWKPFLDLFIRQATAKP